MNEEVTEAALQGSTRTLDPCLARPLSLENSILPQKILLLADAGKASEIEIATMSEPLLRCRLLICK
eukprot:9477933-Pyramimonas_sp.AAC.1